MEATLKKKRTVTGEEMVEAVKQGNFDQIRILKEEGADMNAANPHDHCIKPIHVAAQFSNKAIVEYFLNEGVSVEEKDEDGWTPLHYAARGGQLEVVEYLVEKGADVYAQCTRSGKKPIHPAAAFGHLSIIEYFLSRGMVINEKDKRGWELLHCAAFRNQLLIANFLLDKGANMHAMTFDGEKAIHIAAQCGHKDFIELLLSRGETVEDTDSKNNWTPLHYAAFGGQLEVVRFLITKNGNIHAKSRDKENPMHIAITTGHKSVVEFLICKGTSIDDIGRDGFTNLHYASALGNLELVKLLVEKNANIHAKSDNGSKPIHIAAKNGQKNVVQFFLDKGVNIEERDNKGWTPLHYAAESNHLDVVKFLLEKGADSDNKIYGSTAKAMHIAAYTGHIDVLKLFIEFGHQPNELEPNNNTPLHIAAEKGQWKAAEYLVENGADINAKNILGEKAIHTAAKNGHIVFVQFLLGKNVDIEETDEDDWTPLHYATHNLHLDLMKYLLSKGANIKAKTNVGASPLCMTSMLRPKTITYRHLLSVADEDAFYIRNYKNNLLNGEILDFLIGNEAGINEANEGGLVPLHYAVYNAAGRKVCYIVEKLMDAGAKADIQNIDGETPLHIAAKENYLFAVEKMVESNPNLDLKDNEGNTALHVACSEKNTAVMKCLLAAGARSDIKDNSGRTVLYYYIRDYANYNENYDEDSPLLAEEILGKIGNFMDIDEEERRSAAHFAVECDDCDREFLKLVLGYQKDLNVEDVNGDTALNYLTEEWSTKRGDRCVELITLLINSGAHLKSNDCERLIANPALRSSLLSDAKLCVTSIANKFNLKDLPALIRLPSRVPLPKIEKLKLTSDQLEAIAESVEGQIKDNGYCDVSKMTFSSLKLLSVERYLAHLGSTNYE